MGILKLGSLAFKFYWIAKPVHRPTWKQIHNTGISIHIVVSKSNEVIKKQTLLNLIWFTEVEMMSNFNDLNHIYQIIHLSVTTKMW